MSSLSSFRWSVLARPLLDPIASFCLGREELVPAMLTTFLKSIPIHTPELSAFLWYLKRHIDLDSHEHGPLSARLFRSSTAEDDQKRSEALEAAIIAVRARSRYLDATLEAIRSNKT